MTSNQIQVIFGQLRNDILTSLSESDDANDVRDTWTRLSSFFDHAGSVYYFSFNLIL